MNTRIIWLRIFICFFVFSCKQTVVSTDKGVGSNEKKQTPSNIKYVGYTDKYEALPELILTEISENQYFSLKEKEIHTFNNQEKNITSNKNDYILKTNKSTITLPKENRLSENKQNIGIYNYIGYYEKLSIYGFINTKIVESLNLSEFVMIEKISGDQTRIVSINDDSVNLPIFSSDNRYLSYTAIGEMIFLGILEISKNNSSINFIEKGGAYIDSDSIEISWSDKNSILLKKINQGNITFYKIDL